MIVFADATSEFWSALAHQGPIVLGVAGILWAGHKDVWMYTKNHLAIVAEQGKTIASLREVIAEKDRAATVIQSAYEQRLKEKDEECDRVRDRLTKSEGYTDRLVIAAIDATSLATRAVRKEEAT